MANSAPATSPSLSFTNFDLDSRLLRALAKLGFERPTLVQAEAIPLALKGKDILARARTGSGKTAAYCLPVVQKILVKKESIPNDAADRAATRALILVPTRELAEQVTAHMQSLLSYCANDIKVTNIAANVPVQLQKPLLAELPDIVIATPARALTHLESGSLSLTHLQSLVVDEADLVLSYGYEEDVKTIVTMHLPKLYQSFLMSATLTKDVEGLKSLILKSPAILRLEEEKDEPDLLAQYSVVTSEQDKFLLTYVILKLRLIRGKILIFVNDIDRCYRLKLLLEQFSIRACVLNSELPLNSRYHIVQEFNKGIYDYLIATDEASLKGVTDSDSGSSSSESEGEEEEEETEKPKKKAKAEESKKEEKPVAKGKNRRRQQDKEYGVSRGVDFQGVACVLNFDFPASARAYTHRVGRTARGGQRGMALSFIVPGTESSQKSEVSLPSNAPKMKVPTFHVQSKDEKVVMRVEKLMKEDRGITEGEEASDIIKPYAFDMKQVEGFRYRMEDAMRAVTRPAIREARIKELKQEILNSEKLKAHFEDKPRDLAFLRHDRTLHPTRVQPHLKHIPTYMMPKLSAPKPSGASEPGIGKVSFRSNKSRKAVGGKRKKGDPLKTFSFSSTDGKKKRKRT